jgi:flagellar biosynthesis/type III secretory pathway M-ring protein FliF/YscJ
MIKKSAANSVEAFYPIAPDDKYIRTEIIFDDNTQFYLNPVIRYRGDAPSRPKPAEVNFMKTWMQRIIAAIIAIIIFIVVVKILRPAKKKGHISRRQYYWE